MSDFKIITGSVFSASGPINFIKKTQEKIDILNNQMDKQFWYKDYYLWPVQKDGFRWCGTNLWIIREDLAKTKGLEKIINLGKPGSYVYDHLQSDYYPNISESLSIPKDLDFPFRLFPFKVFSKELNFDVFPMVNDIDEVVLINSATLFLLEDGNYKIYKCSSQMGHVLKVFKENQIVMALACWSSANNKEFSLDEKSILTHIDLKYTDSQNLKKELAEYIDRYAKTRDEAASKELKLQKQINDLTEQRNALLEKTKDLKCETCKWELKREENKKKVLLEFD